MPHEVVFLKDARFDQDVVVFGCPSSVGVAQQLAQCLMWNAADSVVGMEVVDKPRGVGDEFVATTMLVYQCDDLRW